jgi:MYXO-CTERM domain-containing protein
MKRTLVLSLLLATAATAAAERPRPGYLHQSNIPLVTGGDVQVHPQFSNVIYLNNCKAGGGCQVTPGTNNATATPIVSSIPDYASVVTPFAYSDSVWQQVVSCVKATYAPFGVVVTDQKPTSGNYHMAIVAGVPQDVQMQQGVGGVSPFSCGYIPNAVSYSFANVYSGDVDDICWTVAQETAHSWGLDHKYDNRDPMTYLTTGPSKKTFQNASGPCGEYSARNCQCGGASMNSFAAVLATFGGSTPTPPTVKINEPVEGATVLAQFPIKVTVTDDIGVTKGELRIDGQLIATSNELKQGQFVWNAPVTVGQGKHKVSVTGYDVANTPASVEVNVTLGAACTKPADCASDTDTCVDGRCVPGSGVQGGLGSTCAMNSDCASGNCANDGQGETHCVELCSVAANACPGGFTCLDTGNGDLGLCWPSPDDGGGCSSSGNGTTAGWLLALGLGTILVTRRRHR